MEKSDKDTFIQKLASILAYALFDIKGRVLALSALIIFVVWLYLLSIKFSALDMLMQPLCMYLGYRLGWYGPIGLIPGGRFIASRHYCTIRYYDVLKSWRNKWLFFKHNFFKVELTYNKKEMFKGDVTSVREVTGAACLLLGIGFNTYIFVLDKQFLEDE